LQTISTFLTSSERFYLLQATQEQMVQSEAKTLQISPGFLKYRTKLLVVLKIFWKWTRTKAFGQKIYSTK
jgi:hypothetical protein